MRPELSVRAPGMCGLPDTIGGMATLTYGKRAGGKNRLARMRSGSLRVISTGVRDMYSLKAIGVRQVRFKLLRHRSDKKPRAPRGTDGALGNNETMSAELRESAHILGTGEALLHG